MITKEEQQKGRVLAVIPARFESQRLRQKPLAEIAGKTLVRRVLEQAQKAKAVSHVVVATDHESIAAEVEAAGGEALMTSAEITSGSERVAVAAEMMAQRLFPDDAGLATWDAVVNVQGDMPFIAPELIDAAIDKLTSGGDRFAITTVAQAIRDEATFQAPSVVKVVCGPSGNALYFSRAPIPHSRDDVAWNFANGDETLLGLKHIGLYVYRPATLRFFAESERSALERVEMLEQLRVLESGLQIGLVVSDTGRQFSVEVDTPADLERAIEAAQAFDKLA